MKIAIIGSSQYQVKMMNLSNKLGDEGHEVKTPALDNHPTFDVVECCKYNCSIIKWADEVHVIWDSRSIGTIFDFGMAFALGKKLVVDYMEEKTFPKLMKMYASNIDD